MALVDRIHLPDNLEELVEQFRRVSQPEELNQPNTNIDDQPPVIQGEVVYPDGSQSISLSDKHQTLMSIASIFRSLGSVLEILNIAGRNERNSSLIDDLNHIQTNLQTLLNMSNTHPLIHQLICNIVPKETDLTTWLVSDPNNISKLRQAIAMLLANLQTNYGKRANDAQNYGRNTTIPLWNTIGLADNLPPQDKLNKAIALIDQSTDLINSAQKAMYGYVRKQSRLEDANRLKSYFKLMDLVKGILFTIGAPFVALFGSSSFVAANLVTETGDSFSKATEHHPVPALALTVPIILLTILYYFKNPEQLTKPLSFFAIPAISVLAFSVFYGVYNNHQGSK